MNEQEQFLIEQIAAATDRGDIAGIRDYSLALRELQGARIAAADATAVAPPIVETPVIQGPTVGDVDPAGRVPTLAEIRAAQGAVSTPAERATIDIPGIGQIINVPELGGAVLTRGGTSDVLRPFTGQPTGDALRNLVPQFENMVTGLRDREGALISELEQLRAGDLDDRFTNPAFQNVRVANSLEEARQIREAGFIPIAARDAELIRRTGQEQAAQLIADAEDALRIRQGEERFARGQQIGAGLGNAIASALTRSNVGGQQLGRLTGLADQARANVLQGVENRRAARREGGAINARARIDAMLAETEAARQLQELMVADARDSFTRRFQAEQKILARQQQLQDQIRAAEASRPALLATQVSIANQLSRQPQAQFIQPNRIAGLSANANAAALTRVGRIARTGSRIGKLGVTSEGIFRNLDEAGADAEITSLLQDYAELGLLMQQIEEEGQLTPQLAAAVEALDQQVRPLITRLQDSGIIDSEGGVSVERNDRGIGFSADFGKVARRSQAGFDQLIEDFGLGTEVGGGLIPTRGSSTLQSRASASQRADAITADL